MLSECSFRKRSSHGSLVFLVIPASASLYVTFTRRCQPFIDRLRQLDLVLTSLGAEGDTDLHPQ